MRLQPISSGTSHTLLLSAPVAPGCHMQQDSLRSFHVDSWERVKGGRGLSPSRRPDPLGRRVNLEYPTLSWPYGARTLYGSGGWASVPPRATGVPLAGCRGTQAPEQALPLCPPRVPHVRHGVDLGVRYLPDVRSGGLRLQRARTEAPTCDLPPLTQPTPRSSETPLTLCFQIFF